MDILKAIRKNKITCLECGKKLKILTNTHLAKHNLTVAEYKEKYEYHKETLLACENSRKIREKKKN